MIISYWIFIVYYLGHRVFSLLYFINMPFSLLAEFKNRRAFQAMLIVLCLFLIFFFGFKTMDDPDIGWHLRTGEQILARGAVPQADWFTHSFADFSWIDHEWLTNVILYQLYNIGGPFLLSVLFASLLVFIFAYLVPKTFSSRLPLYQNLIIGVLGAGVVTFYVGVRPQLLTLVDVCFLLIIFQKLRRNPDSRALYWLPFLFLAWANLHASFPVGLGIFVVLLAFEAMKRRVLNKTGEFWFAEEKNTLIFPAIKKLAWMLPVSFLATLVNPYGWRIYLEVYRTMLDRYGTREIIEWLAPDVTQTYGIVFGVYLCLFLVVFFFRRAKIDLAHFVLFICFLVAALMSVRHIPLFVIITLPLFLIGVSDFFDEFLIPILKNKAVFIGLTSLCIMGVFTLGQFAQTAKRSLNQNEIFATVDIPVSAVRELKNLGLSGNMFNEYNWGGYLIWQAPEYPVFTDGRTAHWKRDGKNLLQEFLDTATYREGAEATLQKYNISFLFLDPGRPLVRVLQNDPGWEMLYSDDKAVIMKKVTGDK